MLTVDGIPPINQPTSSVRAQTANLAALALQRTYTEPSNRKPITAVLFEAHDPSIPDQGARVFIQPPTTASSPPLLDDLVPPAEPSSHRQSMLTHLLRTSPPEIHEPAPSDSDRPEILQSNTRLHHDSPHLIAASPSPISETSALLPIKGGRHSSYGSDTYFHDDGDEGPGFLHEDLERQGHSGTWSRRGWLRASERRLRSCLKGCDRQFLLEKGVIDPLKRIPAVALGLLLNILDALSYGMILFPLGQPMFEKLGPDGISMFYVSCIISQLVFSLGGSAFKGGIGSEMVQKIL